MATVVGGLQLGAGAQVRVFDAGGDGTTYSQANNWSGDDVPNTAAEDAVIDPGGAFNVNLDVTTTIRDLTIGSDDLLTILNNRSLTVAGGDINNAGTITIASAGSFTDLLTSGGTLTLSGAGTLNLQNAARIQGGGTFVNASTIRGETANGGSIGANNTAITNQAGGLIDANSAAGLALVLDPIAGTGTFVNAGTLRASGGGLLQLTGNGSGSFNNTGGTLQALDGSQVQLVNTASVSGGTLATAGTGVVRVADGNAATIASLTNTGNLTVGNGANLTFSGTITNNATILLASTGGFTDILGGGSTLAGTGTLTMQDAARIRGGGTFTNNSTIAGETTNSGSIGNNDTSIVNAGLIHANVDAVANPGRFLLLDPVAGTGTFQNTGTLRASGGGILRLTGNGSGTFNNAGGTIEALAGSQVQLDNTATVTGGTLTTAGGGTIRVNGGQAATIGGLTNAGTFVVDNGGRLALTGTVTNNGSILLNSTGGFTDLVGGGATLAGTGTLTLQNAARIEGGGTFTNASTVQGETTSSGSIGANNTNIVNQRLIDANVSTANTFLLLDPVAGTGTFQNQAGGTLRASNGGTLRLTGNGGGSFTSTGTILAIGPGSEIQLTNTADVTGTFTTANGGVVRNLDTATLRNATNAGAFVANNGSDTTLVGTLTNNGTILLNSTGGFTDLLGPGATLAGTGTLTLENAARIEGGGTFTNASTIRGETSNGGSIGTNNTRIVNEGLIDANVNTPGAFLLLDPVAGSDTFVNTATGVLRASNGGKLRLSGNGGGTFLNQGSILATGAGSEVQLTQAVTVTGSVPTENGGLVRNVDTATLFNFTNGGTFIANNATTTTLAGTVTNNGTMLLDSTGAFTDLLGPGATLAGTGTLTLQNAARIQGGGTFTNASTIRGETSNGGSIGTNNTAVVNRGVIDANVAGLPLVLDPVAGAGTFDNQAAGTVRASGGGTLRLDGNGAGSFTNVGTFEALNGSTFTFANGATLTNRSGGDLTGGRYRAVSTGGGATLNLPGSPITEINNATELVLSGAGSVIQAGGATVETSLARNDGGTVRILENRNYTAGPATFANDGLLDLGGGTFNATALTNTNVILGFGTVTPRPANSGFVIADGGTLTLSNGVGSTGDSGVLISAGAALDLSASAQDSNAALLGHRGTNLNLGSRNFSVSSDYENASFGTGNSFNPRANVTGSGQILAAPAVQQTVSGTGVTNGASATPTLDLGNIRVGGQVTRDFAVNNVGPTGGPLLRGAIQTNDAAGNGGNVTDARLSGTGVTPQNFGPLATGASTSTVGVTFSGTSAGALTGQRVAVVNNFDNVAEQQVSLTGAAYNPAVPSVTPASVNVGNYHVGDTVPGAAINIANTAPAGAFSEDLLASNIAATPDAVLVAGSPASVAVVAGASSNAVSVGVNTATAGAKSGSVTMNLASNATVNGVPIPGLSPLALGTATVNVTGNVYRLAAPSVQTPKHLGDFHVGDVASGPVAVSNTAPADGFSETLRAQVTGSTPDVTSASGTADVAPGANSGSALTAQVSTATAGAKSGTVSIGLTSLAAAAGLTNTALGTQNATVTANVYNLAAPVINNAQPINFGIVHVGDVVAPVNLSVTNAAPANGFSENLNASAGSPGPGVIGGGSFTGLAPQATNNAALQVGISTASAAVINALYPVNFASDGTGINSLGVTNLPGQAVSVTAQVNNFANARLVKVAGDGTFSGGGTSYLLNFGTVAQDAPDLLAELGVLNDVLAPADTLAGSWSVNAAAFTTSGFNPFTGLAPGATLDDLFVGLDTANTGNFSGTITLMPLSQNASGFSGARPSITLNVQGNVVPEPAACGLMLLGGAVLAGGRRRRRREGR